MDAFEWEILRGDNILLLPPGIFCIRSTDASLHANGNVNTVYGEVVSAPLRERCV
jgi:hypothetical protein